ncbi:MAG: FAD-binding protein, partial [Deltaproteobacteria bacterium]|nr:FAD-binding protein [Deltaproteobacteria bacterium]
IQTEWNKNFLSFSEAKEIREGKGFPGDGLHYSRGDVPWKKMEAICSKILPNWKYKSLNFSEWGRMLEENEPVLMGPAVEYFDGGIVVNERFETNVEGLYAAGECTLGPFGANRVFAATTEMLVHGADAGENAGEYAKDSKKVQPDQQVFKRLRQEAELPLSRKEGIHASQVRKPMQEMAHKMLGPIRTQGELQELIGFLEDIKKDKLPNLVTKSKSRLYNKEWIDSLELANTVHVLEASARSALARTESRGVHYREDFPQTDNENWLLESIVELVDDDLKVSTRPAIITTHTPPKGIMPYMEMMKKMMDEHSDVTGAH